MGSGGALLDMPVDNVTAEVLYPSIAATLFARRDAELAETIATIYNDWLIEYCQHAPERLGACRAFPYGTSTTRFKK